MQKYFYSKKFMRETTARKYTNFLSTFFPSVELMMEEKIWFLTKNIKTVLLSALSHSLLILQCAWSWRKRKILPFFLIVCLCIHYSENLYSKKVEPKELSSIRVLYMKKIGSKKAIKRLKIASCKSWGNFVTVINEFVDSNSILNRFNT